jgi:four helix bundle protein
MDVWTKLIDSDMSLVEDFRDLRVYRRAFETALRVSELSKAWPAEERFALTDQVRRSSRAVCANIAEAWFKRRYPKHFANKLSDAASETAETMVWIDFAQECGYLDGEAADSLREACSGVSGGLVKMMARTEDWCGPASLREEPTDYDTA